MIIELLLFLLFVHIVRKYLRDAKYSHIPGPSPWLSFPLVGHSYMLMGSNPVEVLDQMNKKYGNLFRFDIGGDCPTVWLCTYDQLKEAFSKDSFNGRYWQHIPAISEVADKDHTGKCLLKVR